MIGQLLIFWDYDTKWGYDLSRSPDGPRWDPEDEFENTEQLLELHAEYEIPACFAVVASAAFSGKRPYHDPAQIRCIHELGHEVASHSMHHEWLPGLDSETLRRTLHESKDALEQCIGGPVVTFVPPFNQPFDYLPGLSVSLSERRSTTRPIRTGLRSLCSTLKHVGFRFCRVAYRPLPIRVIDKLSGSPQFKPGRLEMIGGLTCIRINSPCGFNVGTNRLLDQVIARGGFAVVYAHPHSLHSGNSQDHKYLVPFLRRVAELVQVGKLHVHLPRDLVARRI